MDDARKGRHIRFMCSPLDDPRRIELRRSRYQEAYLRRSVSDDLVEIGHGLTQLRRVDGWEAAEAVAVFQRLDSLSVEYTQDREYPLQPLIPLPPAAVPDRSFAELVRRRRSCRVFDQRPLALAQAGTLMFCALGETGRSIVGYEDDKPIEASLRSIPSGGALHPTHLFAAVLQSGDLVPGLYHYHPPEHALEIVKLLPDRDIDTLLAAFPIHPQVVDLVQASVLFFITTKFWRSRAKYGPRGYRYCLQEAGSACQNLSLAVVALDLAHVIIGGFYDDEVHASLEIDGVDHSVVTAIAVGPPSEQPDAEPRRVEL
jgi:SagB-type dehydrogenase family enzyme